MSRAPGAWLGWMAAQLGVIALLVLLAVMLAVDLVDARQTLEDVKEQARACERRTVGGFDPPQRHDDGRPLSAAFGDSAFPDLGVDLGEILQLRVERTQRERVTTSRFGSPEIVRPGSIHVLGLWAPWCEACKRLLPQIRAMFSRRSDDWGETVRFLGLEVLSDEDIVGAYRNYGHLMPSGVQLADKSSEDRFVTLLRDESRRLYDGSLPVTMVLDCSRRVRWARLGGFVAGDLEDLERALDRFAEEVRSGDVRCTRAWCGNGRCDPGDSDRCADDCEPPRPTAHASAEPDRVVPAPQPALAARPRSKRRPGADAPPPLLVETPRAGTPATETPRGCGEGCDLCLRGRCVSTWEPQEQVDRARCGDGRCESRETSATCCQDCGCRGSFQCRRDATKQFACLPPG